MVYKLIFITLLLFTSIVKASSYETGLLAYDSGDYKKAYKIFETLANDGDDKAQSFLGLMLETGTGVKKDLEKSYKWILKSANQGNAGAMYALGMAYFTGHSYPKKDVSKAKEWFLKAATKGEFFSHYELAGMAIDQKNYFDSVNWLRKASTFEFSESDGLAYKKLIEVWHNLGMSYLKGFGVRKDYYAASIWFKRSANAGFASSQLMLGIMYSRGMGVSQSPNEANYWYGLACDNKLQDGCDMYNPGQSR